MTKARKKRRNLALATYFMTSLTAASQSRTVVCLWLNDKDCITSKNEAASLQR